MSFSALRTMAADRRRQAGFTIMELMIGVAIGLLATVVVAKVLLVAEGWRRGSTSGSDAQVSGGLALYSLQRELRMAGYGLTTEGAALGCTLEAQYKTATPAGMPAVLAPAFITDGGGALPDSVRILASSKTTLAVPIQVTPPFYDPDDAVGDKAKRFAVASALGVEQGDLMALVYGPDGKCKVFEVSAAPGVRSIPRESSGDWNSPKFPDAVATASSFLVNLGALADTTFSITADYKLQKSVRNLAGTSVNTQILQSNVVDMRAYYGKDTNSDDMINIFDKATPVNNAGWLQVRAIRLAVLARSTHYEKDEVTPSYPLLDVGTTTSVAGSVDCGTSKCIQFDVSRLGSDWKHYRYKAFEMLVPLRNQLWRSDFKPGLAASHSS